MREEHAAWARRVRQRIDEQRQERAPFSRDRQPTAHEDRWDMAGEESQDPGGWHAA